MDLGAMAKLTKRDRLRILTAKMTTQGYNRDKEDAYNRAEGILLEALLLLSTPRTKPLIVEMLEAYRVVGELRR